MQVEEGIGRVHGESGSTGCWGRCCTYRIEDRAGWWRWMVGGVVDFGDLTGVSFGGLFWLFGCR